MAINIPIITDFDASGLKKAAKAFDGLRAQTSKIGATIKKSFMVATAAVAGLAAVGVSAVKAAIEDQKAQALLARQLRTTTKATDAQIKAVERSITAMSLATGVADDELRPAFASLVRSTRNTTKAQKALRIALNVSKATGRPVIKVAEALSRAYGGNVKALARLDPSLKSMIDKTTTADQAVGMLAKNFAGAAAASAETMQGKIDRASVAFAELKESIGVALLPVVEKLTGFITDKVLPYGQKLADAYGEDGLSGVFKTLTDDAKTLAKDGLGALYDLLNKNIDDADTTSTGFKDTLINLAATLAIVGAAAKGAFELGQLYVGWDDLITKIGAANGALKALGLVSFGTVVAALALVIAAVYELVDALRDPIFRSSFGEFIVNSAKLVANAFIGLYKIIRAALNPVIGLLQKIPGIGGKFGLLPDVNFQKFTFDANAPQFTNPRRFEESAINNVEINVNGGDPQAVVDALVTWTRQNGGLPVPVR